MTKPALLQTGFMMSLIEEGTKKHFAVRRLEDHPDREGFFAKHGPDIVAVSTGSMTGVKVDAAMIARMPKLRIIGNFGVGYDSVDVVAAAKRGIIVTNTPDVLTEEVADTALGLMIMTVREFSRADRYLRAGRWAKEGDYRLTPTSLQSSTLGMVGMGRIGQAIAKRATAFGMPVVYFSRSKKSDVSYLYYADLIAMAKAVDILMVITPGGAGTAKMINADVLAALGPKGILINMARGTVVDEPALIQALKSKTILAAGLDVFLNEPNIDPELLTLENATLLPHVGSASQHTRNLMGQLVVDNVEAFANGAAPKTPVPETPFKGW